MKLEAVSLILVPNKQSPKLYYCHNTYTIKKKKKKKAYIMQNFSGLIIC